LPSPFDKIKGRRRQLGRDNRCVEGRDLKIKGAQVGPELALGLSGMEISLKK
jgi:hypothetical protein